MGETYFYIEYRFSGISIFGSTGLFDCSPVSDGTLSRLSPAQLTMESSPTSRCQEDDGWLWLACVWAANGLDSTCVDGVLGLVTILRLCCPTALATFRS